MSNLRVLQTEKISCTQDASVLLKEAAGLGFEAVVILGVRAGKVHLRASKHVNALQVIGALEAMKQHVVNHWK